MIRGAICGSGLAHDAGSAVFQSNRVDAIASKPAPTEGGGRLSVQGLREAWITILISGIKPVVKLIQRDVPPVFLLLAPLPVRNPSRVTIPTPHKGACLIPRVSCQLLVIPRIFCRGCSSCCDS